MTYRQTFPDGLESALAAARAALRDGDDPAGIAEWLLHQQARCGTLESLLHVVDRYLRFGMPEQELTEMRVLVHKLREHELSDEHSHAVDSTLPL